MHGVKESTVVGAGTAADVKPLLWLLSSVGSASVEQSAQRLKSEDLHGVHGSTGCEETTKAVRR